MPPKPRDQISSRELKLRDSLGRRLSSPPAPTTSAIVPQRHGDRSSSDDDPAARYLSGPQTCRRYNISDMTLWRWLQNPDLDFPRPAMVINGRRFWLERELRQWELSRAAPRKAMATAP